MYYPPTFENNSIISVRKLYEDYRMFIVYQVKQKKKKNQMLFQT